MIRRNKVSKNRGEINNHSNENDEKKRSGTSFDNKKNMGSCGMCVHP
jgi:hypothetical protein